MKYISTFIRAERNSHYFLSHALSNVDEICRDCGEVNFLTGIAFFEDKEGLVKNGHSQIAFSFMLKKYN